MKSVNKIEIMWFSKNYKDDWSNPEAIKYATKYLETDDIEMAHGNIYRFGFSSETDTYDAVVLIPKFQYKLLNAGMALNKLDLDKMDSEFAEYYLEDAEENFQEFYQEVFTKLIKEDLLSEEVFSDNKSVQFNMVSPDVGLHFEGGKFTGYSS